VSHSAGRLFLPATAVLLASLSLSSPAAATTYRLRADGSGDFPTIQAAVNAAVNGDIIELYPGTYTGSGNVDVDYLGKAITIRSRFGIASQVVILCDPFPLVDERGFLFQAGEGPGSVLQAVTIRGGRLHASSMIGGAGIACWFGASPTIRRCVVEDCSSYYPGGGVAVDGSPLIEDCTIRESSSTIIGGGGLIIIAGSPTVSGCVFDGNSTAEDGGGIYSSDYASAQFTDCHFLDNQAGSGGGFYGSGRLEGCVFTGNAADSLGGAITCRDSVSASGCTISGNSVAAEPGAGGVFVEKWDTWPSMPTSYANIENTIIAFSVDGRAVGCRSEGAGVDIACCDVYRNAGGDYIGCIAGLNGLSGNIRANPIFCDIGSGDFTLGSSSPFLPANNTCGVQIGAYGEGCTGVDSPEIAQATLGAFQLSTPAPSPFVGSSTIRFSLPEACRVRLTVHDVAGRRVAVLLDRPHEPGWYDETWSGRNDVGGRVSSGIYFVRLEAGDFTAVRKVIRMK
jgi:predicted outer membrane repeat protein